MNAADLKQGDKVLYLGMDKATVLAVNANGIKISYIGRGLRDGETIIRRVSIRDLSRA